MYYKKIILSAIFLLGFSSQGNAKTFEDDKKDFFKDSVSIDGVSLTFIKEDNTLSPEVEKRLKEVFFHVYPQLVSAYNEDALTSVTIRIDKSYDGVAYASSGRIVISQDWLERMPKDVDVVTHEAMHVIQSYPRRSGPGWLVEGIADYVRHRYGVDNEGGGWSLPDLKEDHHYTNSYRITARFLDWLERNGNEGLVKNLDSALRSRKYSDESWKEFTGKNLDELWEAYKANP